MDTWSDGTELREWKGKAGKILYEDGGREGMESERNVGFKTERKYRPSRPP